MECGFVPAARDPAHRALPAWRRGRHRGQDAGHPADRSAGPAGRGRQPRRAASSSPLKSPPTPPDGHTLFLASATHGINPGLRRGKLPYDTLKDFAPITLVAESPLVFIAHPSLGVGNIKELIAAAKAKPGRINYASSGPGTGGHLSVEMLKHYAGIDMAHVPYKGAGPALIDLIAGQVQAMCTSPLPAMPHVKSGRLKALGMTSRTRSRAAPEVPTVAEQGVPGYESSLWYALLAPAATPQAIVKRVHAETVKILKSSDLAGQLLAQGAEPVGNSPQELQKFVAAEIGRWTKVIEQANIRAD
jgi:tripartite-type tricarboxylate transporter receptor subunit TctC